MRLGYTQSGKKWKSIFVQLDWKKFSTGIFLLRFKCGSYLSSHQVSTFAIWKSASTISAVSHCHISGQICHSDGLVQDSEGLNGNSFVLQTSQKNLSVRLVAFFMRICIDYLSRVIKIILLLLGISLKLFFWSRPLKWKRLRKMSDFFWNFWIIRVQVHNTKNS